MVTLINAKAMRNSQSLNPETYQLEIVCKSTDAKPTDEIDGFHIGNGSLLMEIDTSSFFSFDQDTSSWLPLD